MFKIAVCGFKGSGKTTLINQIIGRCLPTGSAVVLENDDGTVQVEAPTGLRKTVKTITIDSGCICCQSRDLFRSVLSQLSKTAPADLLLLEPSGLASVKDVLALPGSPDSGSDSALASSADFVSDSALAGSADSGSDSVLARKADSAGPLADLVILAIDATRFHPLKKVRGDLFLTDIRLSSIIYLTHTQSESETSPVSESTAGNDGSPSVPDLGLILAEISALNPGCPVLTDPAAVCAEVSRRIASSAQPVYKKLR